MKRSLTLAGMLAVAFMLPALAQDTPMKTPSTTMTAPSSASIMLTDQEVADWLKKPVYSSDGTKVGEVVAFQRGTDNKVTEMHAGIGGFLGIGETIVKVTPAQFKLEGDRVVLMQTAAQAKLLPKVIQQQ